MARQVIVHRVLIRDRRVGYELCAGLRFMLWPLPGSRP
jgi:hypothetical protein